MPLLLLRSAAKRAAMDDPWKVRHRLHPRGQGDCTGCPYFIKKERMCGLGEVKMKVETKPLCGRYIWWDHLKQQQEKEQKEGNGKSESR